MSAGTLPDVRSLRPLAPALAVPLWLVYGCSAADEPGPDRAGVEVRAGLAALYAGDHPTATEREAAACFGEELATRASTAELRAGGLLTADGTVVPEAPPLSADLASAWVDAQFACVDFVEESARAQVAATKGRVDPEEYAGCLRAAIDERQLKAAVAAALTGALDDPAVVRLSAAQQACT